VTKERVLIIASRYDAGSYYTHRWAEDLLSSLATMDHTCLLLNASDLCRAGSTLVDTIGCVDAVVFYGHGQQDEWTALPGQSSGPTVPLVNVATVTLLSAKRVYAGCCHSLVKLGQAYGSAFPGGEYIGYTDAFAFETENQEFFRDVVNNSVIDFVKGTPRQTVSATLEKAWAGLRDAFAGGGILQHRPNAFAASQIADDNYKRVGYAP
jgi:hypothetical protein